MVDVDFYDIPVEKLKDENGKWKYRLKGSIMSPLLGTVILNGEDKEAEKEKAK